MAGPERVKVTGVKEFQRAIRRGESDMKSLEDTGEKAADKLVGPARARAPRRTGALRQSIHTWTQGKVAFVGSDLPYAGVIHNGWPAHNIEAVPFLSDALKDHKDDVLEVYRKDVDGMVHKVGRES